MATITVDVLNFSLAKQGSGPITSAFDVQYDEPLSMCGVWSFKMPARDTKNTLLTVQLSVVRIYADNTEVYLGIVEKKRRVIGSDGVAHFEYSGRSFLAELEDDSVAYLTIYPAAQSSPTTILGEHDETWSLDAINGSAQTTKFVSGRFLGENCLQALVKVTEKIGEHFYYRPALSGADRKIIWKPTIGTASGVRAIQGGGEAVQLEGNANVCLISSLEELEDGADMVTLITPFGGGDDAENSALTLASSTPPTVPAGYTVFPSNNTIRSTTVEITYRRRERHVKFSDISPISNTNPDQTAAADMLVHAAVSYLQRHDRPYKFYRLSVTKLPSTVTPGSGLQVIYYEKDADGTVIHNIDSSFNVLNIVTRYGNDGSVFHELTIAETDRWPTSAEDEIAGRMEEGRVYQAYRQLAPSVDTISYAEPFDDIKSAQLDLWLGAEVTQVQQVFLRFKIDPLRSTVKSVTGGASSESTTLSGGSSTPTSVAAGSALRTSTSAPLGDHVHGFDVLDTSGGSAVTYSAGDNFLKASGSGGGTLIGLATNVAHTHDVTILNHTHDVPVPNHTHGIEHTHSNTNVYGIFEDSGGTVIDDSTLAILKTEITMKVNGVDRTASISDKEEDGATSMPTGWYSLDLTSWVSSATTFRPTAKTHNITCIAQTAGDLGRITAQLQIRTIVQAVAYN